MGTLQADAPDKQVVTTYKEDCVGRQVPAQSTDPAHLQGYPVITLKQAEGSTETRF
jgi:hypothetical protein